MHSSTGEVDTSGVVEHGYEYKFLSDSIVPLQNPVGEDIGDKLLLRKIIDISLVYQKFPIIIG